MSHVVVVGAGFAALTALRVLRAGDPHLQLTLVAPRAELHYLPGIIWIPSGLRRREDLVLPLAPMLKRLQVSWQAGELCGLESGGRVLRVRAGEQVIELANDGLILATGGRFLKKLPGIEHAITPCEGIAAAEQIRERLAALKGGVIACGFAGNPNEPSAMRGGPAFEFLFGIDEWLRRQGRREAFELVFFSPATEPGNRLGPQAVGRLLGEMQRRGIRTHLGHKMQCFEAGRVCTEGGAFDADLILFMPGLTGPAWADATALPRSAGGLLQADALCRVPAWSRVYVAGDAGSYPGPDWMPKQAHMADLQATAAAQNLLAELAGRVPTQRFKVELMCIVDTLGSGLLVWRTPTRNWALPPLRVMHWVKRGFEWLYLRRYRRP